MKDNPYVGPRPYERGDRHNFYGREREARELRSLIVSERVVLFYAQSGAGKTSLLNARVIPALDEEGFHVLPVARVGSELPPGVDPREVDNVFVFSALMALAGEETSPETLVGHTLRSFLEESLPQQEDDLEYRPPLLVFDQFEEVFTTHRDRWQDARGFFAQVREALDALPSLGVVFAMREDHLAELDPYVPLFPRRLRARFRMERLGPKGALEAVTLPALNAGCPFDPGVAERLVDDLRRIKVQSYAGAEEEAVVLGPFIEPVQLQVVCNRLWENLPDQKGDAIQWEEVERHGNIDRALTDFYEIALAQVTRAAGVSERRLRRWFGEKLITPMQTRGLALWGREETAGLPNSAVAVLEGLHLIRADVRAGARWYELTHDRFIEPIQESNKVWGEKRRRTLFAALGAAAAVLVVVFMVVWTIWQRAEAQATAAAAESELWISIARSRVRPLKPGLSVSGVNGTAGTIGALVRDTQGEFYFLSAGDVLGPAGNDLDSLVLQPGRTDGGQVPDDGIGYSARRLSFADGVPVANMVGLARLNEDTAFETSIPGIGLIRGVRDPTPGVSVRALGRTSGLATGEIREAGVTMTISSGPAAFRFVNCIVTSPMAEPGDGGALVVDDEGYAIGIVVAGSESASLLAPVRDVLDSLDVRLVFAGRELSTLGGHEGHVLSADWRRDGAYILTTGQDGTVRVWKASTGQEVARFEHGAALSAAAFSFIGQRVVTVGGGGMVRVWEIDTGQEVTRFEHGAAVSAAAFSSQGRWVVTVGEDGTAQVWEVDAGEEVARMAYEGVVSAIAFSIRGQWLAIASEDGTVQVWEMTTGREVARMAHEGAVLAMAFSSDTQWVATASEDGTARVWEASTGREVARMAHEGAVWAVAFDPDGVRLATAGADGTARLWDAGSGEVIAELAWHTEQINDVAWSPDGTQVVIASSDDLATVWDAASGEWLFTLEGHTDDVLRAAWSPDGTRIVTAGADGTARVWQGR
jgi:WD40 repeat protein